MVSSAEYDLVVGSHVGPVHGRCMVDAWWWWAGASHGGTSHGGETAVGEEIQAHHVGGIVGG